MASSHLKLAQIIMDLDNCLRVTDPLLAFKLTLVQCHQSLIVYPGSECPTLGSFALKTDDLKKMVLIMMIISLVYHTTYPSLARPLSFGECEGVFISFKLFARIVVSTLTVVSSVYTDGSW